VIRRSLAFVGVIAAAVGFGGSVDAEVRVQADLGGIRGSAAASGLHVLYNPKGLLPTGSLLDFGSPDALATITTGPVTFARAGLADPGDVLANPDSLLSQASGSYPSGTIPPWPFRISASSAVGEPVVEQTPAPGLTSRVEADDDGSHATASMPGADVPAIANVSSVVSDTTTKTDGATVTTHAKVRATGFDLLGVVKIDAIVTDLTGTSNAVEAKLLGTTTVTGATVLGRKVTIDAEGIHARAKNAPDFNAILSKVGIKITVADPVTSKTGATGQREASGLRIDLELSTHTVPLLQALVDSLPSIPNPAPGAPGVGDVLAIAQARQTSTILLAGAAVSVDARPAALFDDPVPTFDDAGIVPSVVSGFDLGSSTPLLPDSPLPTAVTPTVTRPAASSKSPLGRGIGGFLLVALLVQPLLGYRLAKGSAALLGGAAPDCMEEEL
jgi:hypothetical protein